MNNKYILITGASQGIGLEIAKIYARNNEKLILVARNEEKLKEIKKEYGENIEIIKADLSNIEETYSIYEETKKRNLKIKTLINNAGVGLFGDFKDTDLEKELNMITLNVSSLVILTKLFLKDMLKENSGTIMNVSSIAGHFPGPKMSIYYASKNFVTEFTNALYYELKDTNIKISILAPGATKTGFVKASSLEKSKLFNNMRVMEAKEVAKIAVENIGKKREIITGNLNKLSIFFSKFIPKNLLMKIINKIQENK